VLVEVTIDADGILTDVHVVVSSPAFDAAAITAARSWLFADAQRNGIPVQARAYLIFGFRQPVIGR
jgi:TonB family protein